MARAVRRGAAFRAMAMLVLAYAGGRMLLSRPDMPLHSIPHARPASRASPTHDIPPLAVSAAEPSRIAPKGQVSRHDAPKAYVPTLQDNTANVTATERFSPYAPLVFPGFSRPPKAPLPSYVPSLQAELTPSPGQGRWLAYSYVHWRPGGMGGGSANFPAYGGSQTFARLSYRFGSDPESSRVAAYVRHSAAFEYPGEAEQALGVEVQPIKNLPLRLHGERRVRQYRPGATALFASGGGSVDSLPFGSRLSIYGQAGTLVDGPDGLLPFYDGQAEWTKPVAVIFGARIHLGAKLSGGGQGKDGRLDIGPMAAGDIAWGNRQMRIEAGWRERVLGNAEPGGGPALTFGVTF